MDSGLINVILGYVKEGSMTEQSASALIRQHGGDPVIFFPIDGHTNGHSSVPDIRAIAAIQPVEPINNQAGVDVTPAPGTVQGQGAGYQFKDVAPLFPSKLKKLNRWIVRTADKRPFSAYEEDDNLGPIDPHDEIYQAEYDTALGALEQTTNYSGLGFVFNYVDGQTGSDFDDCVNAETREIRPDVQAILDKADSYAEFSPSGTGIHLITTGWQFPIGPEGQQGAKVGKAEMYSGKRYFTVTGDHVPGTPLTVNNRNLDWLYERVVKNCEFVSAKSTAGSNAVSDSDSSCVVTKKNTVITTKYETLMT